MTRKVIVLGYARMWPRVAFAKAKGAKGGHAQLIAKSLRFLEGPGVYVLYRDDVPHYVGQAGKLRHRLWGHALNPDSRYFHFWNFFSAFAVADQKDRDELEGVLIAAMPTANSARPKLQRERMPPVVRDLMLQQINLAKSGDPILAKLEGLSKRVERLRKAQRR